MQEFSLFIEGIWSILNKKLHFCRYSHSKLVKPVKKLHFCRYFSFGLEWEGLRDHQIALSYMSLYAGHSYLRLTWLYLVLPSLS